MKDRRKSKYKYLHFVNLGGSAWPDYRNPMPIIRRLDVDKEGQKATTDSLRKMINQYLLEKTLARS
jgi:hypothetical protein